MNIDDPMNPQPTISPLFTQPNIRVNLRQAICALGEALSLVGIDEHQHGERVAYMAVSCARQLEWDGSMVDDLFHVALLHDLGVSSSRVHKHLIAEMDWEGAELHCVLGEHFLANFTPLAHLSPIIRHHHTHWDLLSEYDLTTQQALTANLIYLTDRVDALNAQFSQQPHLSVEAKRSAITGAITQSRGSRFAPELVDAFLSLAANDAFWLTLEPLNLAGYIHEMEEQGHGLLSNYDEIRQLSLIFAHIVDAKSDFTYDHSLGVARLSRHLAELAELPEHRVALIEIAALLHDLGKLGVPDEILDKPASLTAEEVTIMHRHSYDTFRILRHINGFEQIAEWAGNHHETLLGDGYPFHHEQSDLGTESRIIMVADIFQALAQDRPYRKGLAAEVILEELCTLRQAGKIDGTLVGLVEENLDSCIRIATAAAAPWPTSLQ